MLSALMYARTPRITCRLDEPSASSSATIATNGQIRRTRRHRLGCGKGASGGVMDWNGRATTGAANGPHKSKAWANRMPRCRNQARELLQRLSGFSRSAPFIYETAGFLRQGTTGV